MFHPMSIVGSPGTILEIINGNVIFDFQEYIAANGPMSDLHRACISEVSLIFKLDPVRIYNRLKENQEKLNFNKEKLVYQDLCLKYFNLNKNLLQLPLLVIENQTHVEVRDCYLRSMKKETTLNSGSAPANLEMEECGFFLNGQDIYQLNQANSKSYEGSIYLKSCIFYNFYDSIRCGVNGAVHLDKSHLSECRNNSLHAVNPKAVKVT
jgi:hypothetical protein